MLPYARDIWGNPLVFLHRVLYFWQSLVVKEFSQKNIVFTLGLQNNGLSKIRLGKKLFKTVANIHTYLEAMRQTLQSVFVIYGKKKENYIEKL